MELILLTALLGVGLIAGLAGGGGDDGGGGGPLSGPDVIDGTDGDDRIESGAGDDVVTGGLGNDTIFLGIGADIANGNEGDDTIWGGGGPDRVTGGPDDDRIFLEGGDDESTASDIGGIPQDGGNDLIRGGEGNDVISDRYGSNELYGEEGADTLFAVDADGDDTPDLLSGGFGRDTLIGDDGDTMTGGEREDTFEAVFNEVGDGSVTITDFDRSTETLTFEFDSSVFPTYTVTDIMPDFTTSPGDLILTIDGNTVAVLEGVTVYDPAAFAVTMV